MCVWKVGGTNASPASGLDVASAGPATFSAGRHFSDLSAPPGPVLTTWPLHPTGLAWLGRVMLLGIAPVQAGPTCLVVDVSPDQRPDADIPASLGLPVFIFRTFVAHWNLPYSNWTQVARRHVGRLHYRFLTVQIKCQEFLGSRPASTGGSPVANHGHHGKSHFSSTLVVRTIAPSHSQQGDTRHTGLPRRRRLGNRVRQYSSIYKPEGRLAQAQRPS